MKCAKCGSEQVQALMPVWCDPNNGWAPVELDDGAEPLVFFCGKCEDDTSVIDDDGKTKCGRWSCK